MPIALPRKSARGWTPRWRRRWPARGYEIATAPGPGVLRLSPRIVDLYVNAPKSVTTALPGAPIHVSAGKATLVLDVLDAESGRLLGRVIDKRIVGDRGDLQSSLRSTTPPSNIFDFDGVYQDWAQGLVKTLAAPREHAPRGRSPRGNCDCEKRSNLQISNSR